MTPRPKAEPNLQTIGGRILFLLQSRGLDQSGLARELGLGRATVNQWCTNRAQPSPTNLHWLAKYFSVSMAFLIFGTEEPEHTVTNLPPYIQRRKK